MKSQFRRTLVLFLFALVGSSASQACKKKKEDAAAPLVPPTLEFLGASNTAGDEFDPGEDIVVGCDGYLTLDLGPVGDDVGTILNWTLRPANICASLEQCGYVTVEFLDAEDVPIGTFQQAVASPFVDLSDLDLAQIEQIRATLTLGDSGVAFENDGVIVSALWEGSISQACDGMGGAGSEGSGGSGSGGTDPGTGGEGTGGSDGMGGDPAMGGDGGIGGGLPLTP